MEEIICAGFGGQGVLLIGKLVAYAGMVAGKKVSWLPAYGPEMRGGTASCAVIVSDKTVASPVVNKPTLLVAMNAPSLVRFEPAVQAGGSIIINQSLIKETVTRKDVEVYYVPLNDLAMEAGNLRYANMVALGAVIGATQIVPIDYVRDTLVENFKNKPAVVEPNMHAIELGIQFVQEKQNF